MSTNRVSRGLKKQFRGRNSDFFGHNVEGRGFAEGAEETDLQKRGNSIRVNADVEEGEIVEI